MRSNRDFERALKLELPVLYRVARRLGASHEESEDLVQQTVMRAWKSSSQFDGRFFRSWLIKILRNEHWAQQKRDSCEVLLEDDIRDDLLCDNFWSDYDIGWSLSQILKAVDLLPENFRLVIQLCDVEEMSYEEAALALDVPVGTVRSRLFRARAELRKRMTYVL